MLLLLPVSKSSSVTFKTLFSSISKVVSKRGTPFGARRTPVSVAGYGHHLKHTNFHVMDARIDVEEGDIEGTATEIEDEYRPPTPPLVADGHLLEAIREGSGSRLVDDAQDAFRPAMAPASMVAWRGVLDRLAAEVDLGCLPHLGEHHGGNLLGRQPLASPCLDAAPRSPAGRQDL